MRFHCPYCTRDFTRRAALRNHIKTHDTKVDKALQRIAEEAALEQHEITEVAERESSVSSSSNMNQQADIISEEEQHESTEVADKESSEEEQHESTEVADKESSEEEQHKITEVSDKESSASSSSSERQRADMISKGEQEDSNNEWLDVNEVNWFFFLRNTRFYTPDHQMFIEIYYRLNTRCYPSNLCQPLNRLNLARQPMTSQTFQTMNLESLWD